MQIELLVLGSLRIVGSGCTFDAIEELTNVSEETHRVFFHNKFCAWGDRVFPEHVHQPKTEDEIKNVLALYKRIGLPGCAGSIDWCVHGWLVLLETNLVILAVLLGREYHPVFEAFRKPDGMYTQELFLDYCL